MSELNFQSKYFQDIHKILYSPQNPPGTNNLCKEIMNISASFSRNQFFKYALQDYIVISF